MTRVRTVLHTKGITTREAVSYLTLISALAALFFSLRGEWRARRRRGLVAHVEFERLDERARLPERGSERAAGLDISSIEDVVVPPRGRATVRTGLGIIIPRVAEEQGYYARVAPRSGLAKGRGLDVLAGVVDEDFPQELKIILMNNGDEPFHVGAGDRVAQLVLESIIYPRSRWATGPRRLTDRSGGFGSTGAR
ncbi:MAG TPA: dUTP diphosphatase [Pyrinomonadaceae bacterium]